jgi:hypothetical protein
VLGLVDPRVAFDGVQGEVQPPGAFQKTDSRIEQIVDLLPPSKGGDLSAVEFAHPGASQREVIHAQHPDVHHHPPPVEGNIGHRPLAPRMDMGGLDSTSRARHGHPRLRGTHPDQLAFIPHIVDDQAGQTRKHHIDKLVDLEHASA